MIVIVYIHVGYYCLLRVRMALSLCNIRCSVENQKGVISLDKVYGGCTLLVLNETSLNSDNALLALK